MTSFGAKTNNRQRPRLKIFSVRAWKHCFQALRLCYQSRISTSAFSIYKEAWRDRLYEALATLPLVTRGEKVLNPDTDPESPDQRNINRVKMKNIIHTLRSGLSPQGFSALLSRLFPSFFEEICCCMHDDSCAEEAMCCCCECCC
jgi:hypothetical protein